MEIANKFKAKETQRIEYFDVLRVIAMLAVILNHSFGHFSVDEYLKYQGTLLWHIDNILNTFTRFNVPIFFMISGALLLKNDKNISLKYLFKKRIPRVLIPFLVWNIIYIIAYCRVKGGHSIIREFIASIFSTRGYAEHLWYLYALIAIYLILPIVRCFISRTNKALINYALLIWTFFSIFMPFIHQFIPKVQFANYADLNILAGYLGYFILGYKLANSKRTFNTISLVILFIIGWMITAIGGYEYQNLLGNKNIFFQDFLTPNVVVMSITLFIFIKQLLQKHKLSAKIKPIILNLSYLSFGIYLVHFLFRNVGLIIFQKYPVNPYLYLIISPVFVFIMSYITICIASKIKVLSFCITGNKYKKIHN